MHTNVEPLSYTHVWVDWLYWLVALTGCTNSPTSPFPAYQLISQQEQIFKKSVREETYPFIAPCMQLNEFRSFYPVCNSGWIRHAVKHAVDICFSKLRGQKHVTETFRWLMTGSLTGLDSVPFADSVDFPLPSKLTCQCFPLVFYLFPIPCMPTSLGNQILILAAYREDNPDTSHSSGFVLFASWLFRLFRHNRDMHCSSLRGMPLLD